MTVYKSKLEKTFLEAMPKDSLSYESEKLKYEIPATQHKYTPDFHVKGTNIYIETKGIWDLADRKKMLLVRLQHPDKRFIMVFQNPFKKLTKNSKGTYKSWCLEHGIECMTVEEVAKLISGCVDLTS